MMLKRTMLSIILNLLLGFLIMVAWAAPLNNPALIAHAQAVSCTENYIVQADDWLSKLAEKFYGDALAYPAIFEATNTAAMVDLTYPIIANPNVIEIGQTLWIPSLSEAQALLSGPPEVPSVNEIPPNEEDDGSCPRVVSGHPLGSTKMDSRKELAGMTSHP